MMKINTGEMMAGNVFIIGKILNKTKLNRNK